MELDVRGVVVRRVEVDVEEEVVLSVGLVEERVEVLEGVVEVVDDVEEVLDEEVVRSVVVLKNKSWVRGV